MKNMRKIERKMSDLEALELLERGEYGILSTSDDKGQPYGTPLSYYYENNIIYFHGALQGTKLDNIKSNCKVCFTVVGRTEILPDKFSTNYESVMAFGDASLVQGDEKVHALRLLVKKYSPDFVEEGEQYITRAVEKTSIVKIELSHISGKHRA